MMQIYVDNDRDKIGVVEKGEHIEFVDVVDFDSTLNFSRSFVFPNFSIFRYL